MEPPGRGGAKQQGGVLRVILGVLRVILGVLSERTGSGHLWRRRPQRQKNQFKKQTTDYRNVTHDSQQSTVNSQHSNLTRPLPWQAGWADIIYIYI